MTKMRMCEGKRARLNTPEICSAGGARSSKTLFRVTSILDAYILGPNHSSADVCAFYGLARRSFNRFGDIHVGFKMWSRDRNKTTYLTKLLLPQIQFV